MSSLATMAPCCTEGACNERSRLLSACYMCFSYEDALDPPRKVLKFNDRFCRNRLCEKHIIRCIECSAVMCSDHVVYCRDCAVPLCENHHVENYCELHLPPE
jgi:hypothetical protein